MNKLGFKIKFTPAFSPWSNGVNERNHYNCDVIVKKIMDEDKKIGLGEAVDMASWTHNTNMNVLGFKIKFTLAFSPWSNGINERNHYNCDVIVRKIMEEDKKVGLGEAVDMASWTHNTNVNVK